MSLLEPTTEALDSASLQQLLWPQSIAIVGASPKPEKISAKVVNVLRRRGYTGRLYAVNPLYDEVLGMPSVPTARDLPEPVDLAVIVVAAPHVAGVVADCAAAGVAHTVVISSGFGEGKGDGAERVAELLRHVAASGIRISGPNAEGFINLRGSVAATFSPTVEALPDDDSVLPGDVGVVAQSGGLGFALFNDGLHRGLGFSYVITTGNEVDLECLDYVDYLLDDPDTRVVALFVEGLKHPSRLSAIAAKASRLDKVLVAAKVGGSESGRRATISHTAHLAGDDAVYEAVFRRCGIVRAMDQEEVIDIAMAFSRCPLPTGDRIGVLTTSGGGGAWMSDSLEATGLSVPTLSEPLQAKLRALIPAYGSAVNPVDATAQVVQTAGGLAPLLDVMAASGELDAIVLVTTLAGAELVQREETALAAALAAGNIPMMIYTYSGAGPGSIELMSRLGMAWYTSSRRAARALRALVDHAAFIRQGRLAPGAPDVGDWPALEGGPVLVEHRAKRLLRDAGLHVPEGGLATDSRAAGALAERLSGPVAVKVQAADLPHKTEVRGIALDLVGATAVQAAVELMASRLAALGHGAVDGYLVERMAPTGVEMIVGAYRDIDFGPIVLVGLGGIHTEVLKDAVISPAPVSAHEAQEMVSRLNGAALLQGHRGGEPADIAALAACVATVSQLIVARPEIEEVDLNPVFVHPHGSGISVADAMVVIDAEPGPVQQPRDAAA